MNIVFFSVNCSYSHTSLALPFLRAFADPCGDFPWNLIECSSKELEEVVLARLVNSTPDVLFVSCYIFNHIYVRSILQRFRILFPDVKIIAGGPEFLGDNEELLRTDIYDLIIRGEGEIPVKTLLANGFQPEFVNGCCYIDDSGDYHDFGTADEVQNLDDIPSPYQNELVDLSKPFVQYETSRGCPNSCAFCTSSLSESVRFYSLERVKEDLIFLQNAGKKDIRVLDRTFNCNPSRTIKLLKMFREHFPEMRFHAEFDPAFINEKIIAELKLAPVGQLHLETGLQTFSEDTYESVSRKSTMKRTISGLRQLCELDNVEVHADLIAGLPGITLKNLYDDIHRLMEMQPAEIQLENLKLLPGTPVANSDQIYGAPVPPYEVLKTDSMTFYDLTTARHWSRMIDWFYNHPLLQSVFVDLIQENKDFFALFHEFMQAKKVFGSPLTPEKRFRILHSFLKEIGQNPTANKGLICAWFLARFSPEHGLFPATLWKEELPGNCQLLHGSADPSYHWRKFRYQSANGTYFICYGKGHQRNPDTKVSILVQTVNGFK